VGFNSVYHVTDLPGFVSGEHLVFFDPHCKYLPSITAANPGKKIDFVAHPVNSKLSDQVAPFHLFGCNTRQHFQGTLFRFPLRTEQQAAASTISKQVGGVSLQLRVPSYVPSKSDGCPACDATPRQTAGVLATRKARVHVAPSTGQQGCLCRAAPGLQVYTPAAISSMFSDLRQEASLVLLFLKSVCSIEVLELQPGQKEPQLLFSCSVANRSRELLQQRALFSAAVTAPADQQVSGTYRLELVSR
jgi:hypothetical protein